MEILLNNFWLLFIVVTIGNVLMLKHSSKKYILETPELEEGYNQLFKGMLFYGNIPWVVMGFGNLTGMTKSTFEYFFPSHMNPIVLAFHGSILFLWILSAWWIYFNEGAEFLEKHPGVVYRSSFSEDKRVTAKQIKMFFPLMLLGGVTAMIMMWIWF